jgi:hypothetical protein
MVEEGIYGHVFAHGALLAALVRKVKESDPDFENSARLAFDTHLGEYFAQVGTATPMEVEARKMFNAIISTPIGTPRFPPMQPAKPLTWKRRLFNWLEHG